jgi:hypothetical protein
MENQMPNKTQLSSEGAKIAQAVARRTGLNHAVIAPNMRVASGKIDEKPASEDELPDLSVPAMEMRREGYLLYCSLVCNDPNGLRLGMHILHRDGMDVLWSIVARRNGAKVWKLDYESLIECEHDIEQIRIWLNDMIEHGASYMFHDRRCIKLTLFNPVTGQEL